MERVRFVSDVSVQIIWMCAVLLGRCGFEL